MAIVAGYRARKTLSQIAHEAGCSESWVSTVARRAGCLPRHAKALTGKLLRLRIKSYSEQQNRNRRAASG
jgi:hypothetical protein